MPVKPVNPPDEIPTHAGTLCIGGDVFGYEKALKKYEAALQRAKESSIPVQDQERAKRMIMQWLNDQPLGQGMIERNRVHGPFTVEYRIEMDVCHADKETGGCDSRECCLRSAIAILYDDTPGKEPQEDNIEALRKELAEYTKAYNQECERNDAIKKDLEYWAQRSADLLKELEQLKKTMKSG